ncbi:hypothetical protein [Methylobacterium gnaphalii]|uniref:Uncharacterized protein n=1 Tax=Methylobacterium gnaphalii TaxID=1010610 RepID=A0A512JIR7_9HYPH|nr:hypothetical protein [Methylobacterium gnaphalii]GEP09846.1 hypothetical protein MGN01_16910 [Methylobacterium gnaphalii]GJD67239.1 hypothetical protein MMMDOFMJ_0153 [Methylobacterium gnaphalii]GLS49875.1 hypothetical protein GCM10007885_27270 [Methylobacterium gnaphalii]
MSAIVDTFTARIEQAQVAAARPARMPRVRSARADAAEYFRGCGRLRQVELDWFAQGGVSPFMLAGYEVDPAAEGWAVYARVWHGGRDPARLPITLAFEVRRARVVFGARGRFDFDGERRVDPDETVPALILPALAPDGAVEDLVAWHPKSSRLATLFGLSGLLTGFRPQGSAALPVHADPLPWLAGGRVGVVVVHETLARPILLAEPALQAADVAQGEALDAMLRKVRMPKILVPEAAAARAAA